MIDPQVRDRVRKTLEELVELLRPLVMASDSVKLEWVYVTLRTLQKKWPDCS